jgi:hypothetical protein
MSKVILTVSYEILSEKREEYLEYMKEIKEYILKKNNCEYSLFEQIGRKNLFSEIYSFNSKEDYDNFDEVEDEQMEVLLDKLNSEFIKDGKVKSTQMIEVL